MEYKNYELWHDRLAEVVDNFQPGDAEDWIPTTASIGPHAFVLRIVGEMSPDAVICGVVRQVVMDLE